MLSRVPWWVWVGAALLAVFLYQRWEIAGLRQQAVDDQEKTAKAASAAIESTLKVIESRERALEARIQARVAQARVLDRQIVDQTSKTDQTKKEFERITTSGTSAEIVDAARKLGVLAVPARRPK